MFKKVVGAVLFFGFLVASSLHAEAGWYGKAGVSYVLPQQDLSAGDREYSYDAGPGMQLGIGYDYGIFSIEGEYSFTWLNNDGVKDDSEPDFSTNGHQEIHALTINALYHPYVTGISFSPYIGVGLGYGMISWDSSKTDNGIDDDDITYLLQVMAGISYDISKQIALNFEYRYRAFAGYSIDGVGDIDNERFHELHFAMLYRF